VTGSTDLDRGRTAYRRRAWGDARAALTSADEAIPLDADDLERLATAAYLTGRQEEARDAWTRAFHELAGRGASARAARCGFWLAFDLFNAGATARGAGWIAKARRQLEPVEGECAEHGYLNLPDAIQLVYAGDSAGALAIAGSAVALGERCGDVDLVALARCIQGRALMRQGHIAEGMALLDEVMVSVLGDEIGPALSGDIYCSVIEGCQEVYDLRRAQEWTVALTHWCEAQPDLVPYRGQCQVHRAEIMLLRGGWSDAQESADRAHERLSARPGHPAAGAACYLLGELHRLRGTFGDAEEAYRQAAGWGRQPQPGFALLRLAQGQREAAVAAIRRALGETTGPARPPLLAAAVEIMLATGQVGDAHAAADELSTVAAETGAPVLAALAARSTGAVRVAEGDPPAALIHLRRSWTLWHRIEAPYEAAKVRVLIGQACRASGDEDTALMEFDAAAAAFARLGATPDHTLAEALARIEPASAAGGLTAREVEVLRLVATGMSNRAIAAELVLSEKTVARHVSNILAKLGLPSRSAATAYAYEHGLT
jgi:DNA-binding CsgD family transcriptional regulator